MHFDRWKYCPNAKNFTWMMKNLIAVMSWIPVSIIPVKRKDFEKILKILDMTKMPVAERAGGIAYICCKINPNVQFPPS